MSRVVQITRCMDELEVCQRYMRGDDLRDRADAWRGYMDWLYELHFLVREGEADGMVIR